MARVVIDIPDDEYKVILENSEYYKKQNWGSPTVWDAITNGIILPKEHGDLIDREVVYKEFDNADLPEDSKIGKLLIFGIPTVIPSDKGE